jgi:hypothetical protein
VHARESAIALADRRPHSLDDYGFSHHISPSKVR